MGRPWAWGGGKPKAELEVESLASVMETTWAGMQSVCPHRLEHRDGEGQGRMCGHKDNTGSMGWCCVDACPYLPDCK